MATGTAARRRSLLFRLCARRCSGLYGNRGPHGRRAGNRRPCGGAWAARGDIGFSRGARGLPGRYVRPGSGGSGAAQRIRSHGHGAAWHLDSRRVAMGPNSARSVFSPLPLFLVPLVPVPGGSFSGRGIRSTPVPAARANRCAVIDAAANKRTPSFFEINRKRDSPRGYGAPIPGRASLLPRSGGRRIRRPPRVRPEDLSGKTGSTSRRIRGAAGGCAGVSRGTLILGLISRQAKG
jgi:hypothetical protein